MTTEVLLIRHAETALAGTFCGHLDPPLNERGRLQAQALQASLRNVKLSAVFTSDLQRSAQTAYALCKERGNPNAHSPGLREISFGTWEGLRWHEIETGFPSESRQWLASFPHSQAPEGESYSRFSLRVLRALDEYMSTASGTIAVVTHAGPIRLCLRELASISGLEAWQQPIPYASIHRLRRDNADQPWKLVHDRRRIDVG